MRLLVLVVSYPTDVGFYSDWVEAFEKHPGVQAIVHDIGTAKGKRSLPQAMMGTDAIVALHSTTSDWLADLLAVTPVLLDRRVPLAMFVGNEFNYPFPWLAEKIAAVTRLMPDLVLSQLLQETADWLYAGTGARVLSLPHALNPRRYLPGPDRALRRFDLASRSFIYPPYVGDHDRNEIFAAAAKLASHSTFAIDVRLNNRLRADEWARLLRNSRATLSTEAGGMYLERDDRTARQVEDVLRRRGRSGFTLPAWFRRRLRRLPATVKNLLRGAGDMLPMRYAPLAQPDAESAAAIAQIFSRAPKPPVYGKCISGRHFDALGTKTLQLLTPGRYNDILKPNEHYLEVAADGSNLKDALEQARDPAIWGRITEAAWTLGQASTYSARIDRLISELVDRS